MNKNTLSFSIRLETVKQFRSYFNLSYRFHIMGYVENDDFRCDMHLYNDIIIHCPIKELNLVLTDYRPDDIPEIMAYLIDAGMLNEISANVIKDTAA